LGALVIKCANTGREFSTGIQADWDTLARMDNPVLRALCPFCRMEHTWRPDEAKIVDALSPDDWIENQK
jgi:hypothetical protein